MITISRVIGGVGGISLGVFLIVFSWFTSKILIIYGVVILGLGIAIFLNSKEDSIEKIRVKKGIKSKNN